MSAPPGDLKRYEFTQEAMAMPFRIVVYAARETEASLGAAAAFDRIQQLNDILSDYDYDSELNRLSRTSGQGRSVPVSSDLWKVLVAAQALSESSGGAFDATVGPYMNLWRKARRDQRLPDPARLERAREAVGYQHVRLERRARRVELVQPGMRLDMGGIAKGYALDEALRVLRDRGMPRALISGGGDMVLGDAPPGREGWRIAIAALDATNAPPARFVVVSNRAIATSGDLFQRLEIGGRRYSHIVDPRTGVGLTNHSLVTVLAPDAITADSLSTAVSVLGPARGRELVEDTRGASAYMVLESGAAIQVMETRRFGRYLERQPGG